MVGLFDDAKTVLINGNEVKSIEIVGGGYIYRKSDGSHNYNLSLVSNKNSVNYGVQDTVVLTATLTDGNSAVNGEWVSFYKGTPSVVDTLTEDNGNLVVLSDEPYVPLWSGEGVRIGEGCITYYNQLLNFVDDEVIIEFDCKTSDVESTYVLSGQFGLKNGSTNYDCGLFIWTDGTYEFLNHRGSLPSNLLTDVNHIRMEIKNREQKFYVNGSLIITLNQTFEENINYDAYYRSNNYLQFFGYASEQDTTVKNLLISINGVGEIIGASQTNSNGVATFNYASVNTVESVVYAMFSGARDSVELGLLHSYGVDLVSDKNSLNSGESATLTATVTDNNVPLEDKTVLFYDGNIYANPLTVVGDSDFTALYGEGFEVTDNGIRVNNGDRLVHNQLLDMVNDEFIISFKCTPTQSSRYAVVGHFTTSSGAGNSSTNFNIRDDYIDFFGGGYNVPYGLTFGDEWNVRMEIKPSEQSLYINDLLVGTSTMDLTSVTSSSNNYMNLFSFVDEQEFNLKHLGIVTDGGGKFYGFEVTDSNGEAEYTYVSGMVGTFTIIAKWNEQTDSVTLRVS